MLLYHGTSAEVARKALTEGLKPRSATGASNWTHTVESREDAVYLTSVYAGYFAHCAHNDEDILGIVEVETDRLDTKRMLPDEDFLAQGAELSSHPDMRSLVEELDGDLRKLSGYFRTYLHLYQDWWVRSIDTLGTCCYRGVIKPEAITRVSLFNWKEGSIVGWDMLQPSITLINHKIMSKKYAALTKYAMGEELTFAQFVAPFPVDMYPKEQIEATEAELKAHKGVTILK